MKLNIRRLAVLTVLALAAAVSSSSSFAQGPFTGTWTVTKAEDAPWITGRPEMKPHAEPALRKARFEFRKDRVIAPMDWMRCKSPKYEMMSLGFDALFEGGLSNPEKGLNDPKGLANTFGFTSEPVTSMLAGCSELLVHLVDKDTAQFALNNMIYTMRRVGAR